MCQFCNQPDYITCNCQPLEPLCDQCADNSDCYPGRDLACEVYHFDNTQPSKLRNLRLPNGTTGQQFVEAVEAYINGLNTPLIGVDSPSILVSNAGIKGHVIRMDVALSSASGNTLVIEDDGLFADDFPEYKITVNEFDNNPGYLADKVSGTTDALNIITINTEVIDGLLHLSPSTDVAALTSQILNEGDMISSLITNLINSPKFMELLLLSMINNLSFMNSLISAIFNNPTFIENFTNILRDNPSFFLGFFDIIGNNPDILAKFCELLYNCPNCFCDNELTVDFVDCGAAEVTGSFVIGTASSGSITIPISVTGQGVLNINVTVTGGAFSGSVAAILDETSTEVTVPIAYSGAGPAGSYPLTVSFTGATEPVDPCIVNVEVETVPVAPTLNIFARVPFTAAQLVLQVSKASGPNVLTVLSRTQSTVPFDGLWAQDFDNNGLPSVNPSYGTLTKGADVVLNIAPLKYQLPSIPFYVHTYINDVKVGSISVLHGTVYPLAFSAATLESATKLEFLSAFVP